MIARLEALETYFPEREAEIRVFYKQMRARFQPADLSSENVLKMADYIAAGDPAGAVVWYESALARGGTRHRARATLGLANARAAIGQVREAEIGYTKVLETFGTPELAEEATIGIARLAQQKKDWSSTAQYWKSYLDHADWKRARDEAGRGLKLAEANGGKPSAPGQDAARPLRPAPSDPLAIGLAEAESLAAAGKKDAAYHSLDRMLQTVGPAERLPKSSTVPLRKAQMMHEDLGDRAREMRATAGRVSPRRRLVRPIRPIRPIRLIRREHRRRGLRHVYPSPSLATEDPQNGRAQP